MQDRLKNIGILYMVFGAMGVLGLPVIYLQQQVVSLAFTHMARMGPEVQPVLDLMRSVAAFVMPILLVLVVLHIVVNVTVGYLLVRRMAYHVCLATSVFTCLIFPIGTVLGIFSLVTLLDEAAKQQFSSGRAIS